MAYDRERALRLVLSAVRPHLDTRENLQRSPDEVIASVMKAMDEEPEFGAAFDAAVKVVWDTATFYAREETT